MIDTCEAVSEYKKLITNTITRKKRLLFPLSAFLLFPFFPFLPFPTSSFSSLFFPSHP